jgi:hypothetical protein
MDIRSIPIDTLLLYFIMYGCLPAWLIFGLADYVCHRMAKIERTTGIRESILHIVMGGQIAIPVFLGLYFEINVLLLLIAFGVLIFHECVAHIDVKYALHNRPISIWETHVHSFLEVLPFVVVGLIVCRKWSAFVDLVTLNWAGHMALVPKTLPLDAHYIGGYFALMMVADVAPYMEELWRCWRFKQNAVSTAGAVEVPNGN